MIDTYTQRYIHIDAFIIWKYVRKSMHASIHSSILQEKALVVGNVEDLKPIAEAEIKVEQENIIELEKTLAEYRVCMIRIYH